MAKKKTPATPKNPSDPNTPPEPIEMREDQFRLWQTWWSLLLHNAHLIRDARLNVEISQLSMTFLVPNPEVYPVLVQMLVLDFDDDEVTASLTSFTRKSMRAQGEGFHLLREAIFNWKAPTPSFEQFLGEFGLTCPMESPTTLPPGYCYKGQPTDEPPAPTSVPEEPA
jgi:hypothetical protein